MYAALETPSRLWKRVQALEKEGEQLDELPSLPLDSSEDSDFTIDSPRRARSRLLSPARDENNNPKNATPASQGTRSASSTVQASSKTVRPYFSPLQALPMRNSPRTRSPLSESVSSNRSSVQSFSEPNTSVQDQSHFMDEKDMSLTEESTNHSQASSARNMSSISEQDEEQSDSNNSDMVTGTTSLGLGHPGQSKGMLASQAGTTNSDRMPSLTRSVSATHSSPQSSLRSLTSSDVQHQVEIHESDDATQSSGISDSSNNSRPIHPNRFRLPRGPLSNHSSPAKPTPLRSQSVNSSPAIPTRTGLSSAQTPPSARFAPARPASTGSTSTQSVLHSQQLDALATPRPAGTQSDIERRKSHLLATLQLTAKRSQHRAQISRTPYRGANLTMLDGTSSEGGSSAAGGGAASFSSGLGSDSTNDLNPHADSNHSLPLGDRSTRFNGAKLNSYLHSLNTHLTEENQALADAVQTRDAEIQELRDALAEMQEELGHDSTQQTNSSQTSRRSQRSKGADHLREQLQARDAEIAELRDNLLATQGGSDNSEKLQKEVFDLKDRLKVATEANDEQLEALEEKDRDLEAVQNDFVDKMKRLEDELCAVMEEQEGQLEEANKQVEQLRQDRQQVQNELEKAQNELQVIREERNLFAELLDKDGEHSRPSTRVSVVESDVARLQENIKTLEGDKKKLQDECSELEMHSDKLEEAERQLKQLLEARETELETVRQQLEKTLDDNKQIERDLRQQLEEARQRTGDEQMKQAGVDRAARNDFKDQEIANLVSAKAELETRVTALRQQIDVLSATNDVADRTVPFKPIIGIQTPKTPGYFKASNASTSAYSDMTGVAHHQIDILERQVRQLRQQLDEANDELDDKITKLSQACRSQLDANKELAATKARLSRLEEGSAHAAPSECKDLESFRDEIRWLEDELTKARQHIRSLSHRKTTGSGNGDLEEAETRIRELEHEREDLLAGIAGLHRDIQRVRLDAVELGKEISSAPGGTGASISRSLSAQEAHTLLALVRYLKARITRENGLRQDLAYQKTYFLRQLDHKSTLLNSVSAVLRKFELPCLDTLAQETQRSHQTRSHAQQRWSKVAKAVRAIARMSVSRRKWQAQIAEKMALQRAHATVRGRSIS